MIGKKFFLNAREGAFMEKPEPGSHKHVFNEIFGHLVHIAFKETQLGYAMRLYIVSEIDFFIVSMFVRSRPASAFMMLAKNLDLHAEMKFVMTRERDKGGELKDFFSIHQFGGPVRWFYTNENKHLLPTNHDEKSNFLCAVIENEIVPALKKKRNPYPNHCFYKPFGTGNGLAGNYFDSTKNVANIRKNHLSDEDDRELKLAYDKYRRQ